jgi:hypothetical protein
MSPFLSLTVSLTLWEGIKKYNYLLSGLTDGSFVFITKLIKNEPQGSVPDKCKPLIALAGHGGPGSFQGLHKKRLIMNS